MRDDMAKVIVERPRHGGGVKYPRNSVRMTDRVPMVDWHRRQSMRRPWEQGCRGWYGANGKKSLNENLAPLRRYLRSQVGRPWDKVYGEICQRIDRSSAVQLHVWQHLSDFVCTDPISVAGLLERGGGFWRRTEMYVDPHTGLLRVTKQRPRRRWKAREPEGYVRIDAGRCCKRIDGLWYEVELRPVPKVGDRCDVFDVVLKKSGPFSRDELHECYGREVYAVKKRQLNKREIRNLLSTATGRYGRHLPDIVR